MHNTITTCCRKNKGFIKVHYIMNEFCYSFVVYFWSFFLTELNTLSENEPNGGKWGIKFYIQNLTEVFLLWYSCFPFHTVPWHFSTWSYRNQLSHLDHPWSLGCHFLVFCSLYFAVYHIISRHMSQIQMYLGIYRVSQ